MEIVEKYKERVASFALSYREEVNDHTIDVMASVCMTRDKVRIGGSFVQSIVNNDLLEAVVRADAQCCKKLKIITLARQYCFLSEEIYWEQEN